jgi:hypothetical protein
MLLEYQNVGNCPDDAIEKYEPMEQENLEPEVKAGDLKYAEGQDKAVADIASETPVKVGYKVGYGRPPLVTRWKPGQSGNPTGRGKGRANAKTILDRVLNQKVTVCQGDKSVRMPLLEAIFYRHATQGENGDARSANLILGALQKTGAWNDPLVDCSNEISGYGDRNGAVSGTAPNKVRPSDWMLGNIDGVLLSRSEMGELSRLIEIIDIGGDVTALSEKDFGRFKYIVNKGRGKDITPQ